MRKVFSIIAILIIFAIPMVHAQELDQGFIRVFSIPDNVRVKIPELKFKGTLVNDKQMFIENVAEGEYNLGFSYQGNKLKKSIFLVANDTITVSANFFQMGVIAETDADLRKTIDENMRVKFVRDSILASENVIRANKLNEAHTSDNSGNYCDTLYIKGEFEDEEVFYIVEDMPRFNGGDPSIEFRRFIAQNLRFPDGAAEKGIKGRVIVQFAIDPSGRLVDVKVIAGVYPLLDQEAIRVVELSPIWTPGKQRGNPVKVLLTFPINFVLQ